MLGQSLGAERFFPADRRDYQGDTYKRKATVRLRLGEVEAALLLETYGRGEPRWWNLDRVELYLNHPASRWSQLDEVWRRCSAALQGLGYRETSLEWGRLAIETWQLAQSLADGDQIAALGERWVQAVLDVKDDYGDPSRSLKLDHMPAEWIERALQDPSVIEHFRQLSLKYVQIRSLPAGVRQLKALEYLELAYSKISSLPEWLGELTELKKISIHRTPLKRKKKKIETQLAAMLPDCELG